MPCFSDVALFQEFKSNVAFAASLIAAVLAFQDSVASSIAPPY
jgi:hypothetical protein